MHVEDRCSHTYAYFLLLITEAIINTLDLTSQLVAHILLHIACAQSATQPTHAFGAAAKGAEPLDMAWARQE